MRGCLKRRGRKCSRCLSRYSPEVCGRNHRGAYISLQAVETTMLVQMSTMQPVKAPMPEHMDTI